MDRDIILAKKLLEIKGYKISKLSEANLYEMANLTPKKTGLSVQIWSDHAGILRKKRDKDKRVKIGTQDGEYSVSVSIEPTPEILATSNKLKKINLGDSIWKSINQGIEYVARNYDLFLKHYEDTEDEYDDDDLKEDLRKRGDYR